MNSTKKIDDGGPAFHCVVGTDVTSDGLIQVQFQNGDVQWVRHAPGMTLRDYFAAKAMPSIFQDADREKDETLEDFYARVAMGAYMISDAMLAARKSQ